LSLPGWPEFVPFVPFVPSKGEEKPHDPRRPDAQQQKEEAMTTTMEVDGETIEMTDFVPCRAAMYEDDRTVTLQVELRNGRAVVINAWKDGYRSVALWWGSGEHDLINSNEDRGESSKISRVVRARRWQAAIALSRS
jgi:hypothetical protein